MHDIGALQAEIIRLAEIISGLEQENQRAGYLLMTPVIVRDGTDAGYETITVQAALFAFAEYQEYHPHMKMLIVAAEPKDSTNG